ncbi:MAG: efflux RND transporter periplasmic adaptor subunit [Phycisphaeraceae bacterium]|nr:efflux RND transporter periplasmic adaptor subunit [Phycisphaeraceae bacterium]
MLQNDLSKLAAGGASAAVRVPRPPSRAITRIVIPGAVILAAAALLLYSARESLRPALRVTVAPAVLLAASEANRPSSPAGEIVQAPGWIEADPYDVAVPALENGVIRELHVLEGERVEAGDVVASLIDDDAVLAKRLAAAALGNAEAALETARANLNMEVARGEEIRDAVERRETVSIKGAIAEGDLAQQRLKAQTQAAAINSAKAQLTRAESEVALAKVALARTQLALDRMRVVAPVSGVVLLRRVIPGQRVMLSADDPMAGVVVRLYDPAHLQVRVDVPLADAAKVRVGDEAEITTETLPGRTFAGTVTRFVHEADIQKNTVQIKVAIADPAPELKPEMLAKARIRTHLGAQATGAAASGEELEIPRTGITDVRGSEGAAWVLDRTTSTAVKRRITLGSTQGDRVRVLEGIRPGDRVILNPASDLHEGVRVVAVGEQEGK